MLVKLQPVLVICRREISDQFRDWRIIFPVLGLTVFFPFLMNFTASQILTFVAQYGANILADRLVPFLLMIVGFFPVTISLVIALESFVGEKERGSIEPLLNSPLADWQLYLGKLLAAMVPPLVSSYVAMAIYSIGLFGQGLDLPDRLTMIQILVITTLQAVVMVSGAIVVSSQVTSTKAANLLASPIVIPVALLIQVESMVMFWGNGATLWVIALGLAALAILLVRVGLAHFRREELVGREIDTINLRWGWRIFRQAFSGGAKTPGKWYTGVVFPVVKRLRIPAAITVALIITAVIIGGQQEQKLTGLLGDGASVEPESILQYLAQTWPIGSIQPVLSIFWQNLRAMLLGLGLGIFTFGVLGLLPVMATFGIVGYLSTYLVSQGLATPLLFAGFLLPHGVFEIPAAVVATAAVLQMGAILATPSPGKTIGELWLEALADWCKVMIGIVIPLLFLAAVIEAWFTARIMMMFV